jgi:hypothetical protein
MVKRSFGHVELKVQNNCSLLLSLERKWFLLKISMHHLFLDADEHVHRALITYFKKGKKSKKESLLINAFIEKQRHLIKEKKAALVWQGDEYDLKVLYTKVNETYFQGRLDLKVTYFKTPIRKKRHITLGTYNKGVVKINRVLDQKACPAYFVEFILYHEMLHHIFPTKIVNGKRVMHSKEFRQKEKEFKEYPKAKEWKNTILMNTFLRKSDGRT